MTKKKLDERHRAQAARPTKTQRRTTTGQAVREAQTARPTRTQKRITTQDAVKKAVKNAAGMSMASGGAKVAKKIASNPTVQKAARSAYDVRPAASTVKKVASNPTVQKAVRGAVSGATLGAVKPNGGNKAGAKATTARATEAAARKAVMKRAAVTDGKALYEEIKKKSSKRGK